MDYIKILKMIVFLSSELLAILFNYYDYVFTFKI